eukprot:4198985-Prorocentrum_lima.AAC.1
MGRTSQGKSDAPKELAGRQIPRNNKDHNQKTSGKKSWTPTKDPKILPRLHMIREQPAGSNDK